jgi:hypothetical protein
MRRAFVLLVLALVAGPGNRTARVARGADAVPQAAAGRLTVIVSDLHLGVGRNPAGGSWHPD